MFKLCIFLLVKLCILGFASSAFLSDGVRTINFTKANDGSNEYNFEYQLDSGKIHRGQTLLLHHFKSRSLYIVFGANDTIYWVEFTEDEHKNEKPLSKIVRIVERGDDKIKLRDDFIQYELTISTGVMFIAPYRTNWDTENICFAKVENKEQTLFKYVLTGVNNSRRYNGTTYYEADDPHVQRIHLDDGNQRDDVYQVIFTDDELNARNNFCKGISETISTMGVLGAYPVDNINPNLLKSLAG